MNNLAIIDNTLTNAAVKFASTITQYKWNLLPDSQLHAAKLALTKNDYIMKIACNDVDAVRDALLKSAILGLDLTEGKRQGWLLPRKNQQGKTVVTLQVGYKGVEAIHQRMGVLNHLTIRAVRENDIFTWSGDDQEKPDHKASKDRETENWFATDEERGAISGAFATSYFPDESINVVVASIDVIHKNHRDRSDSWKSYQAKLKKGEYAHPPPWASDEQSMVEKTMAYIASKQWPANIRDNETSSKILETLHEIDISDYSLQFSQEQRDAFHSFFENNDPLGMYLFRQRLDIESYAAIFNTFKKGEKTKNKAIVREMEKIGHQLMEDIIQAIADNDEGKLLESMDGTLVVTNKLVLTQLDEHQKTIFNELTNEPIPKTETQ